MHYVDVPKKERKRNNITEGKWNKGGKKINDLIPFYCPAFSRSGLL